MRCNGYHGYDPPIINYWVYKSTKLKWKDAPTFQIPPTQEKFAVVGTCITRKIYKAFSVSLGSELLIQSQSIIRFTHLDNPKYKTLELEKLGMYKISCKNCPLKYIGQTRQSIQTIFKKHTEVRTRKKNPDSLENLMIHTNKHWNMNHDTASTVRYHIQLYLR